jgi:UDP-2-acetamido-2,6-beta-L-arabino-hexul-4-ose reductase
VLSSSIQAELDNPYGRSKKAAEELVLQYHLQSGAPVCLYRLPNVFGKWSRPNYNTVVATFCYNLSRGLPVQLGHRTDPLRFVYIDDVVREFLHIAARSEPDREKTRYELRPVFETTLGELHDLIVSFGNPSLLPDLSNPFVRYLYSTYVSLRDCRDLACPVELNSDDRGWLFELVKAPGAGQVFVSRTRPGITRGNHYHDTKVEKFCVIQGQGIIRLRPVLGSQLVEYFVNDRDIKIVDIPPGYTHSIQNTGPDDLLTLFWASEIFDAQRPDTHSLKVQDQAGL